MVTIPSFICNIVFGSLILILVYRQFRESIKVYLSLIFFIFSQLLQLITITVLSVGTELGGQPTEADCLLQLAAQTFAFLLPGFMLLIITLVRVVFVSRPLSYYSLLRGRYQMGAFAVACAICALIAVLPTLGVCGVAIRDLYLTASEEFFSYCTYPTLCEKSSCSAYFNLLGLGFLCPLLLVVSLYIYIYKLAQRAQKTHRSLTTSSTQPATADSSNKTTSGASGERGPSERTRTEQQTIPWSILAILLINVLACGPWLFSEVYKTEILEKLVVGGAARWLYDVGFACQQALIGACPLVYILTTRSLKLALKKLMSRAVGMG